MPKAKDASHFKPTAKQSGRFSIRQTREERARIPCQCVQSAKRTDRIDDPYDLRVGLAAGRRIDVATELRAHAVAKSGCAASAAAMED